MAEQQTRETKQFESEQGTDQGPWEENTIAERGDENMLERVEMLAAGAEAGDNVDLDGLGEKLDELAATTEEEVDALNINLLQEDGRANARRLRSSD